MASCAAVKRAAGVVVGVLGLLVLVRSEGQESPMEPPRVAVREGRFATGTACALCHSAAPGATALKDASGRSVAPFDLWRGSSMANSARDPIWRAQMAAEVAAFPAERADIEAECLRCHAPMAAHEAALNGEAPVSAKVLDETGPRGALARDGVSCTVCHQITDEGLGDPATFGGRPKLGTERRIFGPHAEPAPGPMRRFVDYTPTHAPHVMKSALCGSCHTLFVPGRTKEGTHAGPEVPEQVTYLEWRNSAFSDEGTLAEGATPRSCQQCHLPTDDLSGEPIQARIARNPVGRDFPFVSPRMPLGRHVLVGGNTLLPALLRDHAAELGVEAPRAALEATIAAATSQLVTQTARLTLDGLRREGDRLKGRVRVENLTGHRLPTGIPLRRLWLRLVVRDAAGAIRFAAGEHDAAGRIVVRAGDATAPHPAELRGGPLHPHRRVVDAADRPQVWQADPGGPDGRPVFRLRGVASLLEDDRLLPRGWSAGHADAKATSPVGVEDDPDFGAGGDAVELDLPVGEAAGPLTLEAALLYQVLGARWADELFAVDAPEVARLKRMWEAADRAPVTVASAAGEVR